MMGQLKNVAILRTGSEMGNRVKDILELPHDGWTNVILKVEVDEPATATVTLFISGEQLVALAQVAADQAVSIAYGPGMPNEDHLEEVLLDIARSTMHSDPDMGPAG